MPSAHASAAVRTEVEAMAEGIAQRVAELLREPGDDGQLIDAAATARRFNLSRDYVYRNAEALGVIRLGDGDRPRLRFDPERVVERLGVRPCKEPERTKPRVRKKGRTSSGAPLIPIRGRP
jgi:hypothetical protein